MADCIDSNNTKFYKHFDKEKFKEVMPKLTSLFRQMNNGVLKSTIVMGFSGKVTTLKGIDHTKVRGYDKLKEQYEKTKDARLKKELQFYDDIVDMEILDTSKKIDIKKLSIYDIVVHNVDED